MGVPRVVARRPQPNYSALLFPNDPPCLLNEAPDMINVSNHMNSLIEKSYRRIRTAFPVHRLWKTPV
jgi:hypothetical protein